MNGNTTRKKRQMLITKYGEFCARCGKLPDEGTLVLNRIDKNNKNTRLENLQLLCRSCVNLRNKTDEHNDLCVNNNHKLKEDSITINRSTEPLFRKQIYDWIDITNLLYDDAVYSGAETIKISPVTARRHLAKMLSKTGKLRKVLILGEEHLQYKEGWTRND